MTLKDDIEIMRALVRDSLPDMPPGLCRTACARAAAAKRVIDLAERAANPALPALLEACEAVQISRTGIDGSTLCISTKHTLDLARAIDHWRAAKAEGFVSSWCDRRERMPDGSHQPACPRNAANAEGFEAPAPGRTLVVHDVMGDDVRTVYVSHTPAKIVWCLRAWGSHYVRVSEFRDYQFASDPRDALQFETDAAAADAASAAFAANPRLGWIEVVRVVLRND